MTDSGTPATGTPAPGWYPDPYGSAGLRWWDGANWGEQVSPAPARPAPAVYGPPPRRPLPEGTPIYTVWIWLVALLPLVASLLLFLLHPQVMFTTRPGTSDLMVSDPFALLGGPLYFVVMGLNWLIAAAIIVFAWLDYRELRRRGVERPFHWAWSFIGLVYPIGRSVIVRGVAGGRGLAPMWVAIAAYLVAFVLGFIWSISLVAQIIGTAHLNVPMGT
ncbi:DUF2510 domain-containing protein [Leifsonia sp. fls2-241-R2A-40a]|uniref:DUF2510 domain-containing protein n=1 Tax=Leifsonia sp. fls2-241-R2A-40a TaxID=3040290 RepID=UPI00254DE3D8|nr:DUF2510 domain-containing protein [Leifsonia sp. fls2-241-R2A-40a]